MRLIEEMAALGRGASQTVIYFDGTHRRSPLEDTLARARFVAPRIGVTRLSDLTFLDRLGVPVWQAVRPASRNLTVSQGKGVSAAAAMVSALMESIEMWHAERVQIDRWAEIGVMVSQLAYRVEELPVAEARNLSHGLPIAWTAAFDLIDRRPSWLPTELIRLNFADDSLSPFAFQASSTGLASGNTHVEALLHALYEVIERDALADSEQNFNLSQSIDWATVTCAFAIRVREHCANVGLDITLQYVPSPTFIPVVKCTISGGTDLPFSGSGAHANPEIALIRAVSEAAQSRLTFISGARDDIEENAYRLFSQQPNRVENSKNEPIASISCNELRDFSTGNLLDDLKALLAIFEQLGLRPITSELSQNDIGMPVVFVAVPGMRRTRRHG